MINFHNENKLCKESPKHKRRKDGDIYIIIKPLQDIHALKEIPGKNHPGMGTIPALDFKVK